MPYINIKEYDNTIVGPKSSNQLIVAVPINSKDGPADRWVQMNTYDEFIQTFGPNPDPNGQFGNSWEYAANLLMREMTVMVRRITNVLNEDGTNTSDLLPGVATAKNIIKVASLTNEANSIDLNSLQESIIGVRDIMGHSVLSKSDPGTSVFVSEYVPNWENKWDDNTSVDENTKRYESFNSIYDLESWTQTKSNDEYTPLDRRSQKVLLGAGCFTDVEDNGSSYPYIETANEWNLLTKPIINPNYKFELNNGASTTLKGGDEIDDDISFDGVGYTDFDKIINQNIIGKTGEFYLIKDPTDVGNIIRVDFVENGYDNPYAHKKIASDYLNYAATLAYEKIDDANVNDFVIVKFNDTNTSSEWKPWIYTGCKFFNTENTFSNYAHNFKFVNGDIVFIRDTNYLYTVTVTENSYKLTKFATIVMDETKLTDINTDDVKFAFVYTTKTVYKFDTEWVNTNDTVITVDRVIENFDITKVLSVVPNNYYIDKVYENEAALNKDKTAARDGNFAYVNADGFIWQYSGKDGKWVQTSYGKTELDKLVIIGIEKDLNNTTAADSMNQFGKLVVIPWVKDANGVRDKGRYSNRLYWQIATDDDDKTHFLKKLFWTNSGNTIGSRNKETIIGANVIINNLTINANADVSKTSISANVNRYTDITIEQDALSNRLTSGIPSITNTSRSPLKIYSLRLTKKNSNGDSVLLYNAGIERIKTRSDSITSDPLVKITETNGNILGTSSLRPHLDATASEERWYIELPAGATLSYQANISGLQFILEAAIFDDSDLIFSLFNSAYGRYDLCFSTFDPLEIIKTALPEKDVEATLADVDITNLPITDGRGNYNLFIASYNNPGSNGNSIRVSIRTIKNQGIYAYVYRNTQYLERIELCPFRVRQSNGRVKIYDVNLDKEHIWKTLLAKFGIAIGINDTYAIPTPLTGAYVTLELNNLIPDYNTYDYIDALIGVDSSKYYNLKFGKDPLDDDVIHEVPYAYDILKDKYKYDISFVSNGAYIDKIVSSSDIMSATATSDDVRLIEDAMLDLAETRQDCVAYLDIPYDVAVEDVPSYYEHISSSYAAAYDPWCQINLATGSAKWMPPSFVQLYTHAKSIASGNKSYLPPAGVRRALVPEIVRTSHELPSSYITTWQNGESAQFINPIIWLNGFDYSIYGQKTLYNIVNQSEMYESALQNLNVRLVANTIKKLIFKTCVELTFELNNIMTWNEFKSKLEPHLSVMQGEGTITTYEILMGVETMTSADLNSGHVVGTVRVAIVNAATDWDINFEIQPNEITFYENDYNSAYTG